MAWISKETIDGAFAQLTSTKNLGVKMFRQAAMERFFATKWENLPIKGQDTFSFQSSSAKRTNIDAHLPKDMLDNPRLVFIDGAYSPEHSVASSEKSITIRPLSLSGEDGDKKIASLTITEDKHYQDSFLNFNSALFSDGANIHVSKNASAGKTILLVYLSTSDAPSKLSVLKNFISLEASSHAAVAEIYAGSETTSNMLNVFTHIHLGKQARLEHSKLQLQGSRSIHLGGVTSLQEEHSELKCLSTAFGSAYSSLDTLSTLKTGSTCHMYGLYFGKDKQRLSHYTCIDHAEPHTNSHELYKGILDQASQGDFTGKIIVRPDAQKIDSNQLSRNLLLSRDAVANSTPQLEIFADDVKCSHGATIGALDDQEVFYLRSRGLSLEQAKRELVTAYAQEVLDLHQDTHLSGYLSNLLIERMALPA